MGLGPTKISADGNNWIVANGVLLTLATIAVGLRLYARKLQGKKLSFNDYAIVLSLVFSAGFSTTLIIAATHGGVGFDLTEVVLTMGDDAVVILVQCSKASEMLYAIAVALIKFSVLHFYINLFPNRTFYKLAIFAMGFSVVTALGTVVDVLLSCRPFAYSWDKTIPGGTCVEDYFLAYLFPCLVNLISDVVVVILPLPVLWRTQLRLPSKLAITGIFSMGIGVCIISSIRLRSVFSLDIYSNITRSIADFGFWTAFEPLLGIINACLPLLRPVIRLPFVWLAKIAAKEKPGVVESDEGARDVTEAKVSAGSRLFRRLYDHIYALGNESGIESEVGLEGTCVAGKHHAEALAAAGEGEGDGAEMRR